jgi:phage recombination protein Bet
MGVALTKSEPSAGLGQLNANQLHLLKRTVASDCNHDEFNLFVEVARNLRLDPFRKQVIPLVFSKDNPAKRRMSIVVGIDGMRRIAARTGNYRPASDEPEFVVDADAKSDTNPHGIVKCRLHVFQQDSRGEWFPVDGTVYWEEFAAVDDEWAWSDQKNKRAPTGKKTLSGNWGKMPRLMIAKCAEAQALRRGWPDDLGGVYAEEELDRTRVSDLASDTLESFERDQRQARLGGRSILFIPDPAAPAEAWPVGEVADKCMAFIRDAALSKQIEWFQSSNREALRQFWSENPGDALEVKAKAEARIENLRAEEQPTDERAA